MKNSQCPFQKFAFILFLLTGANVITNHHWSMGWRLGTTNRIRPFQPELSLVLPLHPLSTLRPLALSRELVSLDLLLRFSCPLVSRWVQPKEHLDRSTAEERRGGSGYLFHWSTHHHCLDTGWQQLCLPKTSVYWMALPASSLSRSCDNTPTLPLPLLFRSRQDKEYLGIWVRAVGGGGAVSPSLVDTLTCTLSIPFIKLPSISLTMFPSETWPMHLKMEGIKPQEWASLVEMEEVHFQSLSREDALEKEMATHSSIRAWKSHGQMSLVDYNQWHRKELDVV